MPNIVHRDEIDSTHNHNLELIYIIQFLLIPTEMWLRFKASSGHLNRAGSNPFSVSILPQINLIIIHKIIMKSLTYHSTLSLNGSSARSAAIEPNVACVLSIEFMWIKTKLSYTSTRCVSVSFSIDVWVHACVYVCAYHTYLYQIQRSQ